LWYKKLGKNFRKRKSKAKFAVEEKKIPKISQFFFQINGGNRGLIIWQEN
jgi:hypothetical protein